MIFLIHRRCNIIKRILIPKLKRTVAYILSELEEREREEMFRIKQFKKLKDRQKRKNEKGKGKSKDKIHLCSCCQAMLESDKEKTADALCETCKVLESDKTNYKFDEIYTGPCNIEDSKIDIKQLLEPLTNHIAEVISLTKVCTQEGLVSQSMERFIESCYEAKEKIENAGNILPVCEVCKQEMQKSERIEIPQSVVETPKSGKSVVSVDTDKTTEGPTDSIYNLSSESAHKFGYFEKKFKEIVKVTRLKNDDGTVSEEKQVITIRTERRNPKKPCAATCGGRNDDPYLGPGGYDGDSGKNFRFARNTKSEHIGHSNNMGEPKVRTCRSAGFQKSPKDASTIYNASDSCFAKCSQLTLGKSSSHSCGPRTVSYESKPASQVTSQNSINITKSCIPSSKSTSSAQTCCKEIPVQKPVQQCNPCCLTSCNGDAVEPKKSEDKKDVCFQTTGTDALWRDAWSSTTELNVEPSRLPNTTQSTASCRSNCGTEVKEPPPPPEKPVIKCRIRILPKATEAEPDKIYYRDTSVKENKPKEENTNQEKQIVLRGSLIDILKSIILPISKPTEKDTTTKVAFMEPDKPKLICKSCISKLSNYVVKQDFDRPSVHSNTSSCKICQVSIESNEQELSSWCSNDTMSATSPSLSYKSYGIGSSSSQLKSSQSSGKPSSDREVQETHEKPHTCCADESKTKNSEGPSCCTLAEKLTSKSACCSTNKSSAGISSISDRTNQSKGCESKDVATSTKRSDKFDVRSLRNIKQSCPKKSSNKQACTCLSEPNICGNRAQNPLFRKSKSCSENDNNNFFRW